MANNIPATQVLLTYQPDQPILAKDIHALVRYLLEIGGTGQGDVVGPASSTDNAIVRFDLATGKLIQNSTVTVSDPGTVNIPVGQTYNVNGVPIPDDFSELTDTYVLSGAPAGSTPVLNTAKTALIPMVLLDNAIEVDVAITAAIAGTWTYNNLGGVGDTLTRTTNGAFATTDGVTAQLNRTYLHTQWTGVNRIRGGGWALSTVGTAGTAAVFTRMTNSDTTSELDAQVVLIGLGTAGRGKVYTQVTQSPVVGTSNIIYQSPSITAPSTVPTAITIIAARALMVAGNVVVGRTYSITNSSQLINAADRIWVQGVSPDDFSTSGLYLDTVNAQMNPIEYVLTAAVDFIRERTDVFGNTVKDLVGNGNILLYKWGSGATWYGNLCNASLIDITLGPVAENIIHDQTNITDGGGGGSLFTNIIDQSCNIQLGGGALIGNFIKNGVTIAQIGAGQMRSNTIGQTSFVTNSGTIANCTIGEGCTVDDAGFTLTQCTFLSGATFTATGNLSNAIIGNQIFTDGTDQIIISPTTVSIGATTVTNSVLTTTGGGYQLLSDGLLRLSTSNNANVLLAPNGTGKAAITIANVIDYADNAAAVAGGLTAGMIYRTSTAGTSVLKIVE